MLSKTKVILTDSQIKEIFTFHGITGITEISPLGEGMFNSVYKVVADKTYALKIAAPNSKVMTYEQNMMKSELYWYDMMKKHTDIATPEIYFSDFSQKLIPANYFIMELVNGAQKDKTKFADKDSANDEIVKMVAKIHSVKNDKFGYIQNGLYNNWYDAYKSIVSGMVEDCKKAGKRTKKGELLLTLADKYKDELIKAESVMVSFDCWNPNFICTDSNNYKFTWIDPERNFWGDRILDFVCLDMMTPIENKYRVLKVYNSVTDNQLIITENEKIRYAFGQGLLGLITEVEKYYRYTPFNKGWWADIGVSNISYRNAFKVLK